MRKIISIIIAVVMVLGVVPFTALTAFAQDDNTSEQASEAVTVTNGDYSITVNKTQFEVGEKIMISATAKASNDWVGIYETNQTATILWDNISTYGNEVSFDAREMTQKGGGYTEELGTLPQGRYVIRLVPNGASDITKTACHVVITVGNPGIVEGDSTLMHIEKNTFAPGESVMVSGKGSGKDWIGIYKLNTPNVTHNNLWKYISNVGQDVMFDVSAGGNLTEGDYLLCLIKNDGSKPINASAWALISVVEKSNITDPDNPGSGETTDPDNPGGGTTDPDNPGGGTTDPDNPSGGETTDPEDPEQGGTDNPDTNDGVTVKNDTHSLSVNKTKFEVGESILVTAEGVDSKDWIGIAERGYMDGTIRWYYIAGVGNGVPFDIRTATNIGGNLSALKDIPEGLYTIYLVEKDAYLKNGYTLSINISVGNIEDADNGKTDGGTVEGDTPVYGAVPPLGAVYVPSVNGYAGGTVTVTMPTEALNSHDIVMYWANENGLLAGYTAHARFKVTGIESSYTFGKSVIIPSGATKLFIYSQRSADGEMSSEFATVDLPKDSQMSITGNKLHSFYAISDVHIGSANGAMHFELMLNDAISLNPNGVAIFISGDITDNGTESQYEELFAIYNEVMRKAGANGADYPMFFAIGNHDYPSAAGAFLSYATLPDGSHPTDTTYDFWFNGYHYIMLGSDNPSGLYSSFSAETLAWLDSVLAENRNASRPTFIFLHQPMYNTVSGSLPGEGWHGVSNEDALRAVLQKYPEIIMFNGHTHWEMNSKGNMFDATEELPINIFNCASVSYLWSGYNKLTGESLYGSQGYYVEVYGDRVVVRGRDFVNGLWLPSAQYCVETGVECEHNLEAQSIEYKNGYLQAGIRTEKCKLCSAIVTTELDAMITFSGYSVREVGAPAICVGYTVDFDALTIYESVMGTEIEIGITAAAYDNLTVEGKPINADGTTCETTGGIVVNYKVEDSYSHINLILNSGNWDKYADKRIILCAYYIENGEVYYLCDREVATQSAGHITYNELKN